MIVNMISKPLNQLVNIKEYHSCLEKLISLISN